MKDSRRRLSTARQLRLGVFLGALLAALLLFVPLAGAVGHPSLGSFCEPSGTGTPPCDPEFGAAAGMAVDPSNGDLLVIDTADRTLSRYHEDGTAAKFSALAGNVIDGHPGEADEVPGIGEILGNFGIATEVEVAVDNSGGATDGDVYVTDSEHHVIDVFASSGAFIGQLSESSAGAFGESCGVAVGPDGDVYVGDYSGFVHKFEPAANPPVNADNTANFAVSEPCSLAAGAGPSAGALFVAHFGGSTLKLNATSGAEEYVVSGDPTTVISVDASSGHLYTVSTTEIKEFDAAAATPVEVSATPLPNFGRGVAADGSAGVFYGTFFEGPNVAVFSLAYKLTVAKSGVGSGTVSGGSVGRPDTIDCGSGAGCEHEYLEGEEVTLVAAPDASSVFTGWSGCTGQPSPSECKVAIDGAKNVVATFKPKLRLTVARSGPGAVRGGSVGRPDTIDCGSGAGCEHEYQQNEIVRLFAFPDPHNQVSWSGCGSLPSPTECKVTLSAARNVTATFTPILHPLAIERTGAGAGTVRCNGGPCANAYGEGTVVTLTATADAGSLFAGWSAAGCSGTAECLVTIAAANTVRATFSRLPPPPAAPACLVPRLAGRSLAQAGAALKSAHCALGEVSKPKRGSGPLVARSSRPAAGTTAAAGTKVDLKLAHKPKKR